MRAPMLLSLWFAFVFVGMASSSIDEEEALDRELEAEAEILAEDVQMDPTTGKRMYEGFKLVRAHPKTEEDLEVLRFLARGIDDMWSPIPRNVSRDPEIPTKDVDMLIGPKQFSKITKFLNCSEVDYDITISDIQRAIDVENEVASIQELQDDNDLKSSIVRSQGDILLPILLANLTRTRRRAHPEAGRQRGNFGDLLRSVFGGYAPKESVRKGRGSTTNFNFDPTPSTTEILTPGPVYYKPLDVEDVLVRGRVTRVIDGVRVVGETSTRVKTSAKSRSLCAFDDMWTKFQQYEEIMEYMNCLKEKYPNIVTMYDIGVSSEGRSLKVLKIGRASRILKPAVWIDGGIHAREWASPASVLYIAYELAERSAQHSDMIDALDIYIMPLMNPDGYKYTFTRDRLWRKTRSRNAGTSCRGVDPNRNWGHSWGGKGASTNPCQETYRGTREFSEPETRLPAQFMMARRNQLKMFLTFHSYGQFLLYPWGYTDKYDPPNVGELENMAVKAASAMRGVNGRSYTHGSAAKLLYPAAGGSDDWAKGALKVQYSFTIELPDEGRYGFLLPARDILNVGREAWAGTRAMIMELMRQ